MRGRYRQSFERPEPISAGSVLDYTVDLHQQAYRFLPGHRMMVQIQSTWFPLYDRNPQTYVPNIFLAKPGDYQAQTHRIYHERQHASRVEVDVFFAYGGGLDYEIRPWLTVGVDYSHIGRRSNFNEFDFQDDKFTARVVLQF